MPGVCQLYLPLNTVRALESKQNTEVTEDIFIV